MSFYIYNGKLNDELFVLVLPKGSAEKGDQVYTFTEKKFQSFKIQEVYINNDGEDDIRFAEGPATYKVTSKNNYTTLIFNQKIAKGSEATVTLTRQYEQAKFLLPVSNSLRIWSGAIDLQDKAKNESFIVVAPQGLGNKKNIVAFWQWSKDERGIASTKDTKQGSEAGKAGNFSFKIGDYSLACEVKEDSGLKVVVTGSDKKGMEQNLVSSAIIAREAEHSLMPPRGPVQNIEFECSRLNDKPAIPRITKPLPFPADLIETLSYTAAYLDQAGYQAQYAVAQFERLEASYNRLEKKSDARSTKIQGLTTEVAIVQTEKENMAKENKRLEEALAREKEEAQKREDALKKQIEEANALVTKTEEEKGDLALMNAALNEYVEHLRAEIEKDKDEDDAREKKWKDLQAKWKKHDTADHNKLKNLRKEFNHYKATTEAEMKAMRKSAAEAIAEKNAVIHKLQDEAEILRTRADLLDKEIIRLQGLLAAEEEKNCNLNKELQDVKHERDIAQDAVLTLRAAISAVEAERDTARDELAALKKKTEEDIRNLKEAITKLDILVKQHEATITQKENTIKKNTDTINSLGSSVNRLNASVKKANDLYRDEKNSHDKDQQELVELREQNAQLERDNARLLGLPSETTESTEVIVETKGSVQTTTSEIHV